jgi:hypothetical protein
VGLSSKIFIRTVQLKLTHPQKRHDKRNNNTLPSSGYRFGALPNKYLAAAARMQFKNSIRSFRKTDCPTSQNAERPWAVPERDSPTGLAGESLVVA